MIKEHLEVARGRDLEQELGFEGFRGSHAVEWWSSGVLEEWEHEG
jgi:hypothetical protein